MKLLVVIVTERIKTGSALLSPSTASLSCSDLSYYRRRPSYTARRRSLSSRVADRYSSRDILASVYVIAYWLITDAILQVSYPSTSMVPGKRPLLLMLVSPTDAFSQYIYFVLLYLGSSRHPRPIHLADH